MQEQLEVLRDLFNGFDATPFYRGSAAARIEIFPAAQEHVLQQSDGKSRLLSATTGLTNALPLGKPKGGGRHPRSAIEQAL